MECGPPAGDVRLPIEARRRLAQPLAALPQLALRSTHSLPIATDTWALYSTEMVRRLTVLADVLESQPRSGAAFDSVRDWVERTVDAHSGAVSLLLALEPFEPFGVAPGREVADQLEATRVGMPAAVIDELRIAPSFGLRSAAASWPLQGGTPQHDLLKVAFALDDSPVDALGEFRPAQVFRAYAYHRTADLIATVMPHLASLGVGFTDVLAAVSVVGALTWAPDQVAAYCAMDALLVALRSGSQQVVAPLISHLRQREGIDRQSRLAVMTAKASVPDDSSEERQALALAEIYRRLVEGPIRQYGWALCMLRDQGWQDPPTLTPIRDAMVAAGGLLQQIADQAVLVSVRNGSAHENLEWDGLDEVYLVGQESVAPEVVNGAVRACLSFDRGFVAAAASFRAERNDPESLLPSADDVNRMPNWERAEAFFGTNGLALASADLNAITAKVVLEHLSHGEINPCFQALMCVHRMLPRVAGFQVRVQGADEPIIRVTAEVLERGMPVWLSALETFDRMPFSTFLPANLAAPSVKEAPIKAARAVAWIAADDALAALDGSAEDWDSGDAALFIDRLGLVELALIQCLPLIEEASRLRPEAVLKAVARLREVMVEPREHAWDYSAVNGVAETIRLRHFWSVWGPVPRLPGVADEQPPDGIREAQPARRVRPTSGTRGWHTF